MNTMKVIAPIFIIGTGRSGSSIFHRMFSSHPNAAWLSQLHARYPTRLEFIKHIMHAINYPLIGRRLRSILDPGECYELWEYICPGFSAPCRDLRADDVTKKSKNRIQDTFSQIVTKKKNRLLIKLTGWSRVGFIREIYPDAKFIHILRDGRAVTNSTLQVDFWWGWRGPQNWRWGELTSHDKDLWVKHNQSFVVLAGIQWKILMDAIEHAKQLINGRNFMEVKYEDICKDPVGVFKKTLIFCELDWSNKFESGLDKFKLESTDFKWKENLTGNQQIALEEVIGDHLKRYGYI